MIELVPLRAAHAEELVGLLAEPQLREWLRSEDVAGLRRRFEGWESGRSPDGRQLWLNWVIRSLPDGRTVGWMQATVENDRAGVAYAVLPEERGHGFAAAALRAAIGDLRKRGVERFDAYIHDANEPSQHVVAAVGFMRTELTSDGDRRWTLAVGSAS
jgi:RimJ/RimL family protein N-acetyltransferase